MLTEDKLRPLLPAPRAPALRALCGIESLFGGEGRHVRNGFACLHKNSERTSFSSSPKHNTRGASRTLPLSPGTIEMSYSTSSRCLKSEVPLCGSSLSPKKTQRKASARSKRKGRCRPVLQGTLEFLEPEGDEDCLESHNASCHSLDGHGFSEEKSTLEDKRELVWTGVWSLSTGHTQDPLPEEVKKAPFWFRRVKLVPSAESERTETEIDQDEQLAGSVDTNSLCEPGICTDAFFEGYFCLEQKLPHGGVEMVRHHEGQLLLRFSRRDPGQPNCEKIVDVLGSGENSFGRFLLQGVFNMETQQLNCARNYFPPKVLTNHFTRQTAATKSDIVPRVRRNLTPVSVRGKSKRLRRPSERLRTVACSPQHVFGQSNQESEFLRGWCGLLRKVIQGREKEAAIMRNFLVFAPMLQELESNQLISISRELLAVDRIFDVALVNCRKERSSQAKSTRMKIIQRLHDMYRKGLRALSNHYTEKTGPLADTLAAYWSENDRLEQRRERKKAKIEDDVFSPDGVDELLGFCIISEMVDFTELDPLLNNPGCPNTRRLSVPPSFNVEEVFHQPKPDAVAPLLDASLKVSSDDEEQEQPQKLCLWTPIDEDGDISQLDLLTLKEINNSYVFPCPDKNSSMRDRCK